MVFWKFIIEIRETYKKKVEKDFVGNWCFFERLRDKDESIDPSKFSEESEEYFELLIKWKETKEQFYLTKKFKCFGLKKILGNVKPLRWWFFLGDFFIFLEPSFDVVDILILGKKEFNRKWVNFAMRVGVKVIPLNLKFTRR